MYVDRLFMVLFICLFFFSHLIQLYRIDQKKKIPKQKLTKHPKPIHQTTTDTNIMKQRPLI